MRRKIISIGNSQGVSIPSEVLDQLGLSLGAAVDVEVDKKARRIIIEPVSPSIYKQGLNEEFVSQVNEFIARYHTALDKLAGK